MLSTKIPLTGIIYASLADEVAETITVTATSVYDDTKSGDATITIG